MMKKYINYNEGKIYYSDNGEGEVVILLHGYLETSEIWAGFADKLSGKFRVICVDLPGHGLSEVYSVNHSMEFMAGAIACLMENL
ncbi:MAG TPA: alpha/beta fold hydrolase, partial [Bacteroidales bacterium]|nr:alpha/beta fold hydrolase [Bacteroidales bacterium]